MDFYRASVLVHLLAAVGLVGMALFWFVMVTALKQRFDRNETDRLLLIANNARWPHVIVPYRLRAPLPLMTWAILGVLLLTGAIVGVAHGFPANAFWWSKIGLLAGVVAVQIPLVRRPVPSLVRLNLIVVLLIVVLSGLTVR